MSAAADQWLTTPTAKVLIEVPLDPLRALQGMSYRVREAYLAGYHDGRKKPDAE